MDPRNRLPVREHSVRRRDPELARAEADPASGQDGEPVAMTGMRSKSLVVAALAALLAAAPARAQDLSGKSVSVLIGFGPGGGYDLCVRTVARHIGKNLPGKPSVVPQNMPGAGSYVAASHIYGAAP